MKRKLETTQEDRPGRRGCSSRRRWWWWDEGGGGGGKGGGGIQPKTGEFIK